MRTVPKSIAYITRGERVLFFRAKEVPEAGAELPGGTLEPGEDPVTGLYREVYEETGLRAFGPATLLGIVDHEPPTCDAPHQLHCYHLALRGDAPESWERVVEEGNGIFTFRFFWVGRANVPEDVRPGHEAFLDDVLRVVSRR